MNNRVNTRSKRIREVNNILDSLEENNETLQIMEASASTLLSNLVSPDGDDFETRTKAIYCANQINYSLEELKVLDSTYYISNDGLDVYNWLKLEKINLLDYVPDCVKEITGSNGVKYDSEIIDFHNCFAPFRKWIKPTINKNGEYFKRGMNLQSDKSLSHPYPENVEANKILKEEIKTLNSQIFALNKEYETYDNKLKGIDNEINKYYEKMSGLLPDDPNREYYQNLINNLNVQRNDYISYLSSLISKIADLQSKKDSIKLLPELKYGYCYDDYYLLQRNVQKFKLVPTKVVVGTRTNQDHWGNSYTYNIYETIIKSVSIGEQESKCEPYIPSLESFDNFLKKDEYSNSPCLCKNINSLNYIKRLYDKAYEKESYYKKLRSSENELKNKKVVQINDTPLLGNDAYELLKSIPNYFYYEAYDGTFMLAKVSKREMIKLNLTIKDIYKDRYSKADYLTKYCVYDKDDYNYTYKNNKYNVNITIELDYSNLSEKDLSLEPIVLIGDENYIYVCNKYKDIILEDIKKAFDIYKKPAEPFSTEYEPEENYKQYISYLTEFPLVNNTQCNMFLDYCINIILPWANNRIVVLKDMITDIGNIEILHDLLIKRLRKNTGSLPIWYQSVVQFDNTYINNLITENLIKNSSKYMLVTKGYDGSNEELFNNHLYCDYIDIQDIDKSYGKNTKFNIGDEIYIINGIKEQKNKIKGIDTIKIEVASKTEPGKIVNENIIRLKLENRLLKWCYTDVPSNIIISKLL